jgi:hypothetical protein
MNRAAVATLLLAGEYAQEGLKRGLVLEERLRTNPYKFGMVGSTDSHTALAAAQEVNFFGKHSGTEPSPTRVENAFAETDKGRIAGGQSVASGLAGVCVEENTRESLFDAMERKEVYATTGSRPFVRFFGGWNFTKDDLNSRQPAFRGFEKDVPMGGDLRPAPADARGPTFMVYALRDPIGANLDRIQIVKGWLDADGRTRERAYNVAWSGDRRLDSKGKLPPVGSTADVKKATWANTIGASALGTIWADPDFDPKRRAFYYARVLEVPTPHWVVYDAFRYGIQLPKDAVLTGQERAYTSPIWYTP